MAGTIVVSLNYKLGAFGSLTLDSAEIGGNFGIKDILLGTAMGSKEHCSIRRRPGKVSAHTLCEHYTLYSCVWSST